MEYKVWRTGVWLFQITCESQITKNSCLNSGKSLEVLNLVFSSISPVWIRLSSWQPDFQSMHLEQKILLTFINVHSHWTIHHNHGSKLYIVHWAQQSLSISDADIQTKHWLFYSSARSQWKTTTNESQAKAIHLRSSQHIKCQCAQQSFTVIDDLESLLCSENKKTATPPHTTYTFHTSLQMSHMYQKVMWFHLFKKNCLRLWQQKVLF